MFTFNKILKIIRERDSLNESPKNILPLETSKIEKEITSYYKNNKTKFKPTNTKYLLKSGDDQNGYYIFIKDDIIHYFVRFKAVKYPKLLKGRLIRQVLVQRIDFSSYSSGIPRKVFFEHLLPTYGVIVSDTEQTLDGRKFWTNAVIEAINDPKYSVFMFNSDNIQKTFIELNTEEQFHESVENIWGDSNFFKKVLLAIAIK